MFLLLLGFFVKTDGLKKSFESEEYGLNNEGGP